MPLRPRHGYAAGPSPWPPGRPLQTRPGVPHQPVKSGGQRVRTANRPISTRFELAVLRGVTTLVPRVHLSVSLAGPAHLAVRTVPALSGLLPPSPATPGSGCPQLHRAATTAEGPRSRGRTGARCCLVLGPFPRPALRTGRAAFTASGAPRIAADHTGTHGRDACPWCGMLLARHRYRVTGMVVASNMTSPSTAGR